VTHGKPGIFIRLSNIIIVHVFFVFAALALILFYPEPDTGRNSSNMESAIFLLFLASTLISLLTVYLVTKRFKQPLDRLIRGLEKTAEGELYYLIETENDEELNRLSGAFNSMTRRLWDNRKELKRINTQLQHSSESIRESQLFLAALIDNSPLSIIVTTPDGEVIIFNPAASEVFGYQSADVVGQNIDRLFVEAPCDLKRVEEEPPGCEAICVRNGGERFPVYMAACRVGAGGNLTDACLYIVRDISESQKFQDMMIRLDRYYTRGEMAGDIAHEINNYLAVLMGNLELLPILLKKGDTEKIDKKLEVMKSTVDRIARFANGLMDTPHDDAKFEQASMNQLVENIIAFLKPQNKFDCIDVRTDLSSDITLLYLDPGQIQQLLVNLIYNASEVLAGREGPKCICVSTALVQIEGQDWAQVEVCDNGPGVPQTREGDLFTNRFTTKRKGHGIGLITCRKIMDLHHGTIGYRNDNGAVFYIRLPLNRQGVDVAETVGEGQPGGQPVAG
jgi:PAS domain S-box-containing protein